MTKKLMTVVLCLLLATLLFGSAMAECTHIWIVGPAATCKAPQLRLCSECGVSEEISPKLDHTWIVGPAATCKGPQRRLCSECGASEEISPTTAHTWIVGPAATCKDPQRRLCSVCGTSEEISPAIAHTWIEGPAATCQDPQRRLCSVCGTSEEISPKLEHTKEIIPAVKATCKTDGATEGSRCSVCKTVIQAPTVIKASAHNYQVSVIPATTTARGYTLNICRACGSTYKNNYTDMLPAEIETPEDYNPEAFGDIVTDENGAPIAYTVDTEAVDSKLTTLVIIAAPDAQGAYMLSNLELSAEFLAKIKEDGIINIRFVVGDAQLEFPIAAFEDAAIASLSDKIVGYTVTVVPNALTEDGQAGCLVVINMNSLGEDGATVQKTEITGLLKGVVLTLAGAELDVTDTKVYVASAE